MKFLGCISSFPTNSPSNSPSRSSRRHVWILKLFCAKSRSRSWLPKLSIFVRILSRLATTAKLSSYSPQLTRNPPVTPAGSQCLLSTVSRNSSPSAKPHRIYWHRYQQQQRGRRWVIAVLAGLGYYGYSKLLREIDELKSVVRAINVDGTGAPIKGYSSRGEVGNGEAEKFEHWERRWRGFPRMKNGDVGQDGEGRL